MPATMSRKDKRRDGSRCNSEQVSVIYKIRENYNKKEVTERKKQRNDEREKKGKNNGSVCVCVWGGGG